MSIKINSLSYKYKKSSNFIFENINLEIKEGTVNVLLGLNGCGKTTLLKNIVGLLKPTSGSIELDEKHFADMSICERSKMIAYVSQQSTINEEYKVLDYLAFGFVNYMKIYERPGNEHYKNIYNLAEKLQITDLLDKYINQISGGERQIVEIASALLQYPKYILLDEPTSALDLKNQAVVINLLNELAKKGKTILLTTHNPNHALKLNANVILMNEGKIEKVGSAKEIINVETLKNIYGNLLTYSEDLTYKELSFK